MAMKARLVAEAHCLRSRRGEEEIKPYWTPNLPLANCSNQHWQAGCLSTHQVIREGDLPRRLTY